jgi:hypothetical protein
MRIVRWDTADAAALLGCQAAWGAALDIDDADGPRMTGQVLAAWLRQGFTGRPWPPARGGEGQADAVEIVALDLADDKAVSACRPAELRVGALGQS